MPKILIGIQLSSTRYSLQSSGNRSGTKSMAKTVKKPNENDILLGRGGKNNQWIGNERLRNMARRYCQDYQKSTKKGKSRISREIVEKVRQLKPPGRFLRKSPTKGEWEDAGDTIAREKTSQVLRDAIQARKSFSNDRNKIIWKDDTISKQPKRKSPPPKVHKTPVLEQFFQPSRPKFPVSQWRENPSLPLAYRSTNHVYSPVYSSLPHPYKSYGCVPDSDPGDSIEDVPNFPSATHPYQYPVTPTSSSIALSTARKRPRYFQESPLIQGYHQYPYPTPIRNVNRLTSPCSPTVFTTPTNTKTKTRGLNFSPTNLDQNKEENLSSLRRISTLHTAEKTKHQGDKTAQTSPLGAPSEMSKDIPQQQQQDRSDQNQNFDSLLLLTDDVLSDTDSKNNSTHLFSSHQDELMF